MASVPPGVPTQRPPSRAASVLQAIARAYFQRERQRLGIDAEEREAQAASTTDLVKRAQLARLAQEMELAPAEAGLRTRLIESQIRNYDEPNRLPPAPPVDKPPNIGSFEDYVIQKYGARPTPEQIAEARKVYQQADDRPRVGSTTILPYVVSMGGQPTVIDRRTGKPIEGVEPAPTVAQRNANAGVTAGQMGVKLAQQRALPVLQDIGSRAMALNAGSTGGLGARVRGIGRRVAGKVGRDPAADLYTSDIRGFVPLLARAVGHVGVLTELDVERTEDLFPRIGDAEDVSQEKLARLNRIMTGREPLPFQFEQPEYDSRGITQQQQGGGAATPPPAEGGGQTRVINGVTYVKVQGGWKRQ